MPFLLVISIIVIGCGMSFGLALLAYRHHVLTGKMQAVERALRIFNVAGVQIQFGDPDAVISVPTGEGKSPFQIVHRLVDFNELLHASSYVSNWQYAQALQNNLVRSVRQNLENRERALTKPCLKLIKNDSGREKS